MKAQKSILLTLLIGALTMNVTIAQTAFKEELPTGKVNRKVKDQKNKQTPKKKEYQYIYVDDAHKLMIGNPCAIEFTRGMGFEYEIWHRPDDRFHSIWGRILHNSWVKTKLTFTRGPWWRARVTKRFEECAIQTGDFRG